MPEKGGSFAVREQRFFLLATMSLRGLCRRLRSWGDMTESTLSLWPLCERMKLTSCQRAR